ncbi:putative LPS assembly protein LptD [Sphingobacterium sp. UT-1RO-CII-1]|uniref:putative LPS assembly protein LptD n=1 Tax=Sphingobacterium sp. UT-1RO-CII-1 TaxID=2995225 RepID=UPI00227CBAA5|nr:putative LPS assembly protein LptD [Sphingobacterium sp. UT-1RO-CII-1]MCY4779756.1 putative LPS assembly protein LptD [Sphingobacterium sp. UT-1RO-CII-1]
MFIFISFAALNAQVITPADKKSSIVPDTTVSSADTIGNHLKETTGQDTVQVKNKEGLETVVTIVANDSSWNQVDKNVLHLYKGAKVKYETFELAADYIRLDRNTNQLFASGVIDHNGKYVGRPVVIFPGDSPKTVDSLLYDYKSQEGNTYGIMTEEDGAYIQARVVRKNLYDELSLQRGMYSTCNLPYPYTHFGINFTKGLAAKNHIIVGPAHLVIENIPIKFLAIPFGFFPRTNKRSSGFLFPSFGEDATRGFAIRDAGWYLAFSDYWDSEIRGTLYSKGSWETNIRTNYLVNYKYSGGFTVRYARTKSGVEGTDNYGSDTDFNVTWNHTQRQEANPGTSFSASVNFATRSYFKNTGMNQHNSIRDLTQNNMSSSIAYGKVFADGKVNFTTNMSHRQDMTTGKVDLELPSFNLNVATFNPFDSKDRVGEQKWYQRITVGYSLQGRNTISTGDSILFKKESLKNFTNGFQHSIPVSLSLNAFKHFQFNTSVNYTERWYLQSIRKRLFNEVEGFGEARDTVQGFRRAYDYSLSTGLSTKIYGTYPKIGKIEALRHVVTPSVNFNYRPDFSDPKYGFYKEFVDKDGVLRKYSVFEGAMYGGPGAGKSMGIGFSIDNNIEAKVKNKKDSTGTNAVKKIPIIQGLTFSGNYNFMADSLKLSTISFSGRTSIFNEKINLNFNGILDPYIVNDEGIRIDRFALKDGKLARLTNFGLSFDYSLNPSANKSRNDNIDSLRNQMSNMTPEQAQALARISTDPNAFVDFNIPWNLNGSFSFNYNKQWDNSRQVMRNNITATVNLNGDFNVTPKWKVQFNTGYDLQQKKLSLTRFNIYRDLHCWDLSVGWTPFGQYQSYNITIRAKASILQDLKLTKSQSHYRY